MNQSKFFAKISILIFDKILNEQKTKKTNYIKPRKFIRYINHQHTNKNQ